MVTRLQVKVKTFFKEMLDMTENMPQNPTNSGSNGHEQTRRRPLVALLVFGEHRSMLVTTGAIYFLSRIFLDNPENLSGAIVIFAITLVIAIGLVATAIGTFRTESWTRGAIVTWQILQFAVATSFIQGIQAWQPVGWLLIVLQLAQLFCFYSPRLTAMTAEK
jgi:hypothetical protein